MCKHDYSLFLSSQNNFWSRFLFSTGRCFGRYWCSLQVQRPRGGFSCWLHWNKYPTFLEEEASKRKFTTKAVKNWKGPAAHKNELKFLPLLTVLGGGGGGEGVAFCVTINFTWSPHEALWYSFEWPITRTRSGHDIFYITHFVTQLKDFQIHRLTPKKSKGRVFIYFYNQSLFSYSRTSKFRKMKFKKSYRKQLDARILTLGDLNFKRWNVVPSWVSDMKCASSDITTIW